MSSSLDHSNPVAPSRAGAPDAALHLPELGELTGIDGVGEPVHQAEPGVAGEAADRELGAAPEPGPGRRVQVDVDDEHGTRCGREPLGRPAEQRGGVAGGRLPQQRGAHHRLDGVGPGRGSSFARAGAGVEAEDTARRVDAHVGQDRGPVVEDLRDR